MKKYTEYDWQGKPMCVQLETGGVRVCVGVCMYV